MTHIHIKDAQFDKFISNKQKSWENSLHDENLYLYPSSVLEPFQSFPVFVLLEDFKIKIEING